MVLCLVDSSALVRPKVGLVGRVHLRYQVLILGEVPIFITVEAVVKVDAIPASTTVLLHHSVGVEERVHTLDPSIIVVLL